MRLAFTAPATPSLQKGLLRRCRQQREIISRPLHKHAQRKTQRPFSMRIGLYAPKKKTLRHKFSRHWQVKFYLPQKAKKVLVMTLIFVPSENCSSASLSKERKISFSPRPSLARSNCTLATLAMPLQLPPLSLYIHVPWCIRKCPYCDFNSHAAQENLPEHDYIQMLLADLDADLHYVQERAIQSIFIGGGTPSLLSVSAYQNLFQGLKHVLNLFQIAKLP